MAEVSETISMRNNATRKFIVASALCMAGAACHAATSAPLASVSDESPFALGWDAFLGGYGHAVLLIALLLAERTLPSLTRTLFAFVVAASTSMTMVALTQAAIPDFVMNGGMALCIMLVGFGNLLRVRKAMFYAPVEWRESSTRWPVAFGCGLLIGLVFGETELHLKPESPDFFSIIWQFNFGAIAAVAIIVALLFPSLYLMERRNQQLHSAVLRTGSVLFIIGGLVWFACAGWPFLRLLGQTLGSWLLLHDPNPKNIQQIINEKLISLPE